MLWREESQPRQAHLSCPKDANTPIHSMLQLDRVVWHSATPQIPSVDNVRATDAMSHDASPNHAVRSRPLMLETCLEYIVGLLIQGSWSGTT